MKIKPVCNRSSASHFASARLKYFRRVGLCLFATIVIGLMTFIVVQSAQLYWLLIWPFVLGFFNYRYWMRLARDGYFECDACWKIKHTRHIMVFHDPTSGDTHVWCDRCVKSMRQVARSMRDIRSIIAGLLVSNRIESRKQVAKPYQPMPKPTLTPVPIEPEVTIVHHTNTPGPILQVSDPGFPTKHSEMAV